MLRLTALDHVGLKAANMDETLRFYQRLGLAVLRAKGPDGDGVRSAVIEVGTQELNVFSHPDFAASGPDFAVSGRGTSVGLDHFCLIVEAASIEDVVAELRQAGIEIARGPVERRDGTALFVHDPDGVRVELQLKRQATA